MQITFAGFHNSNTKRKHSYKLDLHLTDRDFLIFRFLLDMKFASKEAIAEKFFWPKSQKPDEKTLFKTRDRLYKLQLHKWILPIQFPGSAKNYFQATWKAYYEVLKTNPQDSLPKPLGTPDYKCFEHDKLVLESRLLLERIHGIKAWVSDKSLRVALGSLKSQSSDFNIPDGIYLTSDNQKVAFEFERVQKSKTDYREKIRNLVRTIRLPSKAFLDFEKIHFVCQTNAIFEFLKKETEIYGDLFQIQRSSEFFNPSMNF